jgi:hypothetical protein
MCFISSFKRSTTSLMLMGLLADGYKDNTLRCTPTESCHDPISCQRVGCKLTRKVSSTAGALDATTPVVPCSMSTTNQSVLVTPTRQQPALEGGVFSEADALTTVPTGQTQGCKPTATTFLSEQVGRQHLHPSKPRGKDRFSQRFHCTAHLIVQMVNMMCAGSVCD